MRISDWSSDVCSSDLFDAIGFYLSAHPLEAYRKSCDRLGVLDWADVQAGRVRDIRVKMAGIVGARKIINSARGGKIAFVQMSDTSGDRKSTRLNSSH